MCACDERIMALSIICTCLCVTPYRPKREKKLLETGHLEYETICILDTNPILKKLGHFIKCKLKKLQ